MSPTLPEEKWRQFLADVQAQWPVPAADVIRTRNISELVSVLQREMELPRHRIALEVQAMLRVFGRRAECAAGNLEQRVA